MQAGAGRLQAIAGGHGARNWPHRWKIRPSTGLRAAIGPSIGVCCYEVGPEVAHRFATWNSAMRQARGPVHLDLRAINEAQLRAAGVANIWKSGECTFCLPGKFYSFRREREHAGRMLSFIGVAEMMTGRTT